MTRPGLEPAPPASEANALTITLSGPVKYIQCMYLISEGKSRSLLFESYLNLNATKCTFGHSDISSRKQQKPEK